MNYSTLSLSELKALATANNVVPMGDKRSKKAWIDALELALQSTVDTSATLSTSLTDSVGEACLKDEMECAAVAVDMATAADSEHVSVTDYVDIPETTAQQEAPAPTTTKKGATSVFASLLCILILTIQAVLCIGCVIVQAVIHLKNLFGPYNPDYDLFGQLHDMVRQRESIVPAQQAQQPAYQ